MKLHLVPLHLAAASEYVRAHHRHHVPPVGHKFAIGVADNAGQLHGVVIAGRPVNRTLDTGTALEVYRVATDGTPNACSMLYGAARRAGVALGYPAQQIITYTLASEPGVSLHAAGWIRDGEVNGRTWSTPLRPRTDKHPTGDKVRWRAAK